jgi:ubiquitin carboxyl-terminal hydrolase 10
VIARGGAADATKQVFIETVPPILVVHIKRFLYDGHGVQKSNKVLLYKTYLEIPNGSFLIDRSM